MLRQCALTWHASEAAHTHGKTKIIAKYYLLRTKMEPYLQLNHMPNYWYRTQARFKGVKVFKITSQPGYKQHIFKVRQISDKINNYLFDVEDQEEKYRV